MEQNIAAGTQKATKDKTVTLTRDQENAKALAALLGIEEDDAAQRLGLRIAVNFDPTNAAAAELGQHVIEMLGRTVQFAGIPDNGEFAAEIVIGPRLPVTSAVAAVFAGEDGEEFVISRSDPLPRCDLAFPRVLLVVAACYIAAAALRAALGPDFPIRNASPIVLSWSQLFGPDFRRLAQAVDIGETYLAGAGAVGHGFLYSLRALDVSGTLYITDPKKVTSGGLNRCLFFGSGDLNYPKAGRLCELAQPDFSRLALVPVDKELDEARRLRGDDFLIGRLVVAVDSRRARRSLQAALPGEVFDSSTTDVTEIVLHFNRQPTDLACLSCVYPENDRERLHEENVAEALGLTIDDVRLGFITPTVASKISARYPDLTPENLAGRAFDTVYKELCGVGKLKIVGGQQILAPFSFVSVLAGAFLAIEFALRVGEPEVERFNYWRASPWHSPVPELRQFRPRDLHCELCSRAAIRRVLESLWPRRPNAA